MKDQILKLRKEGKTYKEIVTILNCTKSKVCYYCGINQREKTVARVKKRRKSDVLISKIERFKNRIISEKSRSFQRRDGSMLIPRIEYNFTLEDVKLKIGNEPRCYLSGKLLDLSNGKSFHFDHIIPATKGGTNTLENLGLLSSEINKMKSDLTIEEFLQNCKEILEYNNYSVIKQK